MEKFRFLRKEKISQIPKTAGVYAFWGKEGFLYLGKASNLRERVKTHFQQPSYRDGLFLDRIKKIGWISTDSEIEALILEARLIKKHQPKYNIVWRDDKNYFFVGIAKEGFPRVFLTHQPAKIFASQKLRRASQKLKINYVGPFVEGTTLKKALRTLRKIFPYYTVKKHPRGPCSWCHLQLCPGPNPDKREYQKNIKNLSSVLKGRRKIVLTRLKREMEKASLSQDYERAAKIRDQVWALERVLAHARIFSETVDVKHQQGKNWQSVQKILQKILKMKGGISRIEAYDVSNIQGNLATGSMITFIDGKPDKNFYRRFKIEIAGKPDDIGMIKEILKRRFRHLEWGLPNLILIDGGTGQLKAALKIKNLSRTETKFLVRGQKSKIKKKIMVISLSKKENKLHIENRKKPILLKSLPREIFNLILQLRDEAHRFAITYHKKLRYRALLK